MFPLQKPLSELGGSDSSLVWPPSILRINHFTGNKWPCDPGPRPAMPQSAKVKKYKRRRLTHLFLTSRSEAPLLVSRPQERGVFNGRGEAPQKQTFPQTNGLPGSKTTRFSRDVAPMKRPPLVDFLRLLALH